MLMQEATRTAEGYVPEQLRPIADWMRETSNVWGCKRRKSLTLGMVGQLMHEDVAAMRRWMDDISSCLQMSLLRFLSRNNMQQVWSRMTRECGEAKLKFSFPTHHYVSPNASPRSALTQMRAEWMAIRENVLRVIDLRMTWLAENGFIGTVSSTDERTCIIHFSTAIVKQSTYGNERHVSMQRVDHAHTLEWAREYPINIRELVMPERTRAFWNSVPRSLQPFFTVLQGTLTRKESRVAGSPSVTVETLRSPDPALLFAGYALEVWDEGELLSEARTSRRSATMRAVFLILKIACIAAFLVSCYHLFR